MSSGFYKLDMVNGGLLYASNYVHTSNGSLTKEDEASKLTELDGWKWFDNDISAYAYHNITSTQQPWKVSSAQGTIALAQLGLLDSLNAYIATKDIVTQLAWSKTTEFQITSPMLRQITLVELNWTEQQLIDVFTLASSIIL
jgi:hypothetical protein